MKNFPAGNITGTMIAKSSSHPVMASQLIRMPDWINNYSIILKMVSYEIHVQNSKGNIYQTLAVLDKKNNP